MTKYLACLFILLSIVACQRQQQKKEETPTSGQLTLCVSESHAALIQWEADKFDSLYPEAKISVIKATTREAIVNLLNDSVRAIIVDRALNAEEQKIAAEAELDLKQIRIAEDALALLVHRANAVESISQETFKAILTRKIVDWNELPESKLVGPIALVLTGRNSGAYELLQKHFYNLPQELIPTIVPESQDHVLEYVGNHPEAIGVVSLACYKHPTTKQTSQDTTDKVRALAIAGTDSTGQPARFRLHQYNVYMGRYPMHYPVYYYFNTRRSTLAAGFGSFLSSGPGQNIITKWGLAPATQPVRFIQLI